MARILLYDIETASNLGHVWGKYQQDVIRFEREWYMLCFAYKWLGERKTYVVSLPDFKEYKKDKQNDYKVVKALYDLFEEADVVIAHNGDSFDQKMAHARFAYHGFPPPAPYKQVDTKKIAKRYFRFTSNKLDDLGEKLGLGRKAQTGGFDLWVGCMNGDPKAWSKMKRYNKQDVVLLEAIYKRLLPWVTNHPKTNLLDGRPTNCENCGKGPMHNHTKKTLAGQGWRTQYKCYNCGHYQIGKKIHKFNEVLE